MRSVEVVTREGTVERRRPVIGDMRWDGKVWRRWSGRRWARAVASARPDRLHTSTPLDHDPVLDAERRARLLELAVEDQVTTNRASVVFTGRNGVVLAYRRSVSHVAHALMTALTGGLWLIVWIACATNRREDRVRLEADRWGNVWAVPVVGA